MKNKTYYIDEVRKMTIKEVEEKKINRIVKTSNFDKDWFNEEFVCENINPKFLFMVFGSIDNFYNNGKGEMYFKLCSEDYELYIGMIP